jgi:hypothetical protein
MYTVLAERPKDITPPELHAHSNTRTAKQQYQKVLREKPKCALIVVFRPVVVGQIFEMVLDLLLRRPRVL